MKVKALVDFGGQYAMYKGNAAELPDNPVTRGLISGGFIAEITEPEKPDLSKLKKDDLLRLCEEKGIEADEKMKKEDLIKLLEAGEEDPVPEQDPESQE